MSEVRRELVLHPKTVAKAETLAKKAKTERDARRQRPTLPTPEVIHRYRKKPPWMSPLVWSAALRLAGGDWKRVVLNSPTEAVVENHGPR